MPYHIYAQWMRQNIFDKVENPNILEIGVDVGQTLLPIMNYFTLFRKQFSYTGLDIRKDENLSEILAQMMIMQGQNIRYEIANSLEWMPKCESQFDLILIDGDHNYHTVYEELKHIDRLLSIGGSVICDDYEGRWAEKDLYYATRDTHKDVSIATKPEGFHVWNQQHIENKKGVKNAIDDFIKENDNWVMSQPIKSEAVLLQRKI